jgi:LETM1-like protein
MINPSINGWIVKYFMDIKSNENNNENFYYENLRSSGFIYGNIVALSSQNININNELTNSELSKIVYLDSIFHAFKLIDNHSSQENFIEKSNAFFEALKPHRNNFFEKMIFKSAPEITLENYIDNRIYINENNFSKKFSNLITNAFLFIDVLAFQKYLLKNKIPENYLSKIEDSIINVLTIALKTKTIKSNHDDLLIKLFENSIRYTNFSKIQYLTLENLNLEIFETNFEKKYLLDLASLAIWSDKKIENSETYFIQKLAEKLKLNDELAKESILKTNDFVEKNRFRIPLFNNSNPVKSFYDQTAQTVVKLIIRNKNRLSKEISQSKELMKLLALSAKRDLDEDEKKKVKKQLLDICKTVPSLTIFLIPGGSLLLPVLIKFIPQLLPSAFNENLEEE